VVKYQHETGRHLEDAESCERDDDDRDGHHEDHDDDKHHDRE